MDYLKKRELNRLGNILIYFALNTENCGAVKTNKLLYYLDCFHLLKHGRTVLNDVYKKLPEGPVPSEVYERIDSILKLKEFENDFDEYLTEFIDVVMDDVSYGDKCYCLHKIIPKKDFESKWFSKSEIEVMREVAEKYRDTTAKEMSHQTHQELPYRSVEPHGEVDLLLYLKDKLPPEKISEIEHIRRTSSSIKLNYQ